MDWFDSQSHQINSEDDFDYALSELIRAAIANNIEISGALGVNVDGPPEYGIEIYPVVRDDD